MFQALATDDLMVIDIIFDNPSNWYELSESHAIGAGHVVLIRDRLGGSPLIYTLKSANPTQRQSNRTW